MQLKTILNLVEKHPGFVYGRVTLVRTSGSERSAKAGCSADESVRSGDAQVAAVRRGGA